MVPRPLDSGDPGYNLWAWDFNVTNGFGIWDNDIRDNDIRDNDMVGKLTFGKHAFGKKTWSLTLHE